MQTLTRSTILARNPCFVASRFWPCRTYPTCLVRSTSCRATRLAQPLPLLVLPSACRLEHVLARPRPGQALASSTRLAPSTSSPCRRPTRRLLAALTGLAPPVLHSRPRHPQRPAATRRAQAGPRSCRALPTCQCLAALTYWPCLHDLPCRKLEQVHNVPARLAQARAMVTPCRNDQP
jgi:hypothetical protein